MLKLIQIAIIAACVTGAVTCSEHGWKDFWTFNATFNFLTLLNLQLAEIRDGKDA